MGAMNGGSAQVADGDLGAALAAVEDAVTRMTSLPDAVLDGVDEQGLTSALGRLSRPLRQLEGLRARMAATVQARRVDAAGQVPRSITRREQQRELADQQRLPPSEAKRVVEAGQAARDHAATGDALRAGDLDAAQAQLISRILADLLPQDRETVEAELLVLARRHDAVAFGRKARALLAARRPEALARSAREQHRARRVRAADTADGGFAFSGLLYGSAAEQARVALQAFRRPDTPDEHRTPEQRGADAFEQLCQAALKTGAAPTSHGVRPQVVVVFTAEEFARLEHDATNVTGRLLNSGQTISGADLRHLVADSQLLRLVVDADSTPLEVSTVVRTVPRGLWRALQVRDQGCAWPGCDAPPAWCDVAHGEQAFADDGKLAPENAMLLCRRHHRRFDNGPRQVVIEGGTVFFPHLNASADSGPGAGSGHQQPPPIVPYLQSGAVTIRVPRPRATPSRPSEGVRSARVAGVPAAPGGGCSARVAGVAAAPGGGCSARVDEARPNRPADGRSRAPPPHLDPASLGTDRHTRGPPYPCQRTDLAGWHGKRGTSRGTSRGLGRPNRLGLPDIRALLPILSGIGPSRTAAEGRPR